MVVSGLARAGGLMALLVLLCGCGEREVVGGGERAAAAGTGRTVHVDGARGYRVSFPASWHLASERMSRLTDPRERFTLGTMPLRWRRTGCEAFAGAAGAGMGVRDVVLTVWERGHDAGSTWPDFPPRPRRFGPVADAGPAEPGCREPPGTVIHWRNFTDAGRHFHTLVRVGPEAPPSAAAEAWRILDGLCIDPGYRPGWRASG